MLLEFCNSDLQKLIDRRCVLPELQAETIIWHIFRAQHDLSLKKVIHRDLKPSNIGLHFNGLLSHEAGDAGFLGNFDFYTNESTYKIKFFDLGLSEMADDNGFGSTSTSGTPFYSSPEQLRGGFQTHNSDMWSIGCIFYQLLSGHLPFLGKTREEIIEAQKRKITTSEFSQPVSEKNLLLIQNCLERISYRRFSISK
jgi:serine/threonine protein kinase